MTTAEALVLLDNEQAKHAKRITELEQRTDRLAETLRTVVDLLVSADADLGARVGELEDAMFPSFEPSATQSDGGIPVSRAGLLHRLRSRS